jgi:prepilin-type N-terminal cleavage/methylation domain-containing protein
MKNLLRKQKASGFTIIEVMIVLAIAGLIMVIVFIAVPQLQRNQRDNARQNITNRLKAEMENYAGNNQGQYQFATACTGATGTKGEWCNFYDNYIGGGKVKVTDPSTGADGISRASGTPAGFTLLTCGASDTCSGVTLPANRGDVAIVYGASCNGESLARSPLGVTPTLQTRTFAVVYGLDRGGTRYCVDNG